MMHFVIAYLKQRRRIIAAMLLFLLIVAASFLLYHLPLAAVAYPALICAAAALVYAAVDIRRCLQRHRQLVRMHRQSAATLETLPPSNLIEVQDYQAIVRMLQEETAQQETLTSRRYSDMVDYYTLWAHQIKTPIASMKLQLQNADDMRSRQLSAELNRIEQYVEMVLAYLRLDSATTDYVFREVDIDQLVRSSIRRFSGDFITRRLSVDYAPIDLRVITDEKWLGFVIEQVLSNALKYTMEGGVSIYLEEPGTLCIRDTGIGIAPEDLPRLFENGYTGLNGRSEKQSSGLGLHLCKRICKALGHDITITSQLDRGTCVHINLHKPAQTFE